MLDATEPYAESEVVEPQAKRAGLLMACLLVEQGWRKRLVLQTMAGGNEYRSLQGRLVVRGRVPVEWELTMTRLGRRKIHVFKEVLQLLEIHALVSRHPKPE